MAFIRRTGIQPLLDALARHRAAGRQLRVLTTVYTGSTEAGALDALHALGADIRVSYDESTTRLHAKAWLFHRSSGFSTAYIGSSNLTHSAQVTGLEWNVRASRARNAAIVDKVAAVFESYWESGDFAPYDRDRFLDHVDQSRRARRDPLLSPIELRPEPFQARMLEQLALARREGRHRNLLVAATGTGKTVMAVLDYARLAASLPRARLLFVAHREEILTQSMRLFRHGLRNGAFGEKWVGGHRPDRFEHVFASIQSLDAAGTASLDPAHFDVVIIDEFHHSAAKSYRALLDHLRPVELLGLTATPERSDGQSVLDFFEGRIAAELRVWDAIDRHFLSPFTYYGIHDETDLTQLPWRRGRGYDVDGLTNLLTADDVWARRVLAELERRVDDPRAMRALGFCVSVDHARFMARVFRAHGVPAVAVWADTPDEERRAALRDLADRKVNIVFSVDLFNEGVDVPSVDTLLMLRPTDSPTLFLQQLGRGLRKASSKTSCTVLDFVGRHHAEFRFDRRLGALLSGTRAEIARQVSEGFPLLPAGCHMELDPVAREIVLANIKAAVASARELRWSPRASLRTTTKVIAHDPHRAGQREDRCRAGLQTQATVGERTGTTHVEKQRPDFYQPECRRGTPRDRPRRHRDARRASGCDTTSAHRDRLRIRHRMGGRRRLPTHPPRDRSTTRSSGLGVAFQRAGRGPRATLRTPQPIPRGRPCPHLLHERPNVPTSGCRSSPTGN